MANVSFKFLHHLCLISENKNEIDKYSLMSL